MFRVSFNYSRSKRGRKKNFCTLQRESVMWFVVLLSFVYVFSTSEHDEISHIVFYRQKV